MKNEKAVTLIALIVTIIVLIILAGVSLTALTQGEKGTIDKAEQGGQQAQRESIIQKIEADIYTEKIKIGKNLTKAQAESIISEYGTIQDSILTTKEGGYKIELSEIIGWKQAEN